MTDDVAQGRHSFWQTAAGLRDSWYVACTSGELGSRRPLSCTVLGLGLALFRTRDGAVVALLDQCLHRGTALSGGRIQDECIVCPYHGWRYDKTGRVTRIPTVDGNGAPSHPHPWVQRRFETREKHGLVWVYMGEGEPDENGIFTMPFRESPDWVSYYMVNTFDGDVSTLAQNFMDVPHTIHVHDTIFRKSTGRRMQITVVRTPASVEVEYHETGDAIGMLPWLTNPRREPLVHTDKFFAPNITRCDYHWGNASGFVITSQMTPIDAQRSRVYTLISYRFPFPRWLLGLIRPFIHLYTHVVIQQDVRIIRLHRKGLDNAPGARTRNVEADTTHVAIEKLIEARRHGKSMAVDELGARDVSFEM